MSHIASFVLCSAPHEVPTGHKLPSMHDTAGASRPAPYGAEDSRRFPREDAGTNKALHIPVGAHKIRRQISSVWILQNRWGKDKEPLHRQQRHLFWSHSSRKLTIWDSYMACAKVSHERGSCKERQTRFISKVPICLWTRNKIQRIQPREYEDYVRVHQLVSLPSCLHLIVWAGAFAVCKSY